MMNKKQRKHLQQPPTKRASIKRLVKDGFVSARDVLAEKSITITSPRLRTWLVRRAQREA